MTDTTALKALAMEWRNEAEVCRQVHLLGTHPAVMKREQLIYEKCASQVEALIAIAEKE